MCSTPYFSLSTMSLTQWVLWVCWNSENRNLLCKCIICFTFFLAFIHLLPGAYNNMYVYPHFSKLPAFYHVKLNFASCFDAGSAASLKYILTHDAALKQQTVQENAYFHVVLAGNLTVIKETLDLIVNTNVKVSYKIRQIPVIPMKKKPESTD